MPDDPRKSLEYNLIWMERTFKERSVTESLLAPERENGLLNHHDYELALAFLPGIHRHYNTIGTAVGAAASYAVKRPKWPTGRTAGFVFFGALAGRAIGSAIAVTSHYKFIGSIQEPEKFAKAMDNIQHRLGQPILRDVPIIMKPAPSSPSAASPDFVDSPDPYAQPVHQDQDQPPARSNVASSPPPPISHQTQTSWDRIRRANANGAQQSSWDAIRQNHEKAEMQRRPPPQSQSTSDSPARDSRAEEQAKFDAMLEKERNFRSNT